MEIFNDNSPPLYSSKDANYCFDKDMMKQVKESLRIVRTRPLHTKVQGESKPNKEGGTPWILGVKPRPSKHPGNKKKNFSTNFLRVCSSDFDEAGYLKHKKKKLGETLTLIHKRRYLWNSEYEGSNDRPNFEDDPSMAASPSDVGKSTDQHEKNLP